MKALAAASLNKLCFDTATGFVRTQVQIGVSALLWSFWRAEVWSAKWVGLASADEVLDCGVIWMDVGWKKNTREAYLAWMGVAVATGISLFWDIPGWSNHLRYRKIAFLVS